jgi:hypothetical protein
MNEGNSDSVPLVSVGLPSRETARSFCSAWKSFTFSSRKRKRTRLWVGVTHALLEGLRPTGSVIPQAGVRFALLDDLRGSTDFFLGNSGMGSDRATAAAARAWTCDSDKLRNSVGACKWGVVSKSSLCRDEGRLFRWTNGRKAPVAGTPSRNGLTGRFGRR